MKRVQVLVAVAIASLFSVSAMATIPASVSTSFDAMKVDIQAVFDIAFPIMLAVVGLTLVWRYVSRYARKI